MLGETPINCTPSAVSLALCTVTPRLATMPISRVRAARERRNSNSSRVNCGLRRSISRYFLGSQLHHDDAGDAVAISAHIGDVLGDVDIHAGDDRHDGDEGGGGKNNPEQRQEAAQLAAAQGPESARHGFPERCMSRLHPMTLTFRPWTS